MNLLCRLEHLHGQGILVEGCEYFIRDNGLCFDVPEEHASLLLKQADTWHQVHPEDVTRVQDVPHQVGTQQPPNVQHLILPPGKTLQLPDDIRIEGDPEKVSGRTKRKQKGRRP